MGPSLAVALSVFMISYALLASFHSAESREI